MSMRHFLLAFTLIGLGASAHPVLGIATGAMAITIFFYILTKEEKRIVEASKNYRITTLSMVRTKNENLKDM